MARGVKTPEAKVREFRREYLKTGNADASARAVGLPETTGQELANQANDDPVFVEARGKIRARFLPELEQALHDLLPVVVERIRDKPLTPVEQAELMEAHGLKSFSVQDTRPAYLAQLANIAKALARSAEADRVATPPTITVNLHRLPPRPEPVPEPEPSGDG